MSQLYETTSVLIYRHVSVAVSYFTITITCPSSMPRGDRYILNRIDSNKIKPRAIPQNTSQWETIPYFTETYCIQLTLQYHINITLSSD